jgi:hypothetical protein
MLFESIALILPSSVFVNAPYTVLQDPAKRESQYMDSIGFYIRETPFTRIIVCDNSGFVYPPSLQMLAASYDKEIELLSFTGNITLVTSLGKGYGEGEIMEYVFKNSRLLRAVNGFLKVTGRLKLVNVTPVIQKSDIDRNYFMPVSLLRPRFLVPRAARPCVDIKVYYCTKQFFSDTLLTVYKTVRERETYFLEHAYYTAIAASGKRVYCFSPAPEFTGFSGSNGWRLKERSKLKKLLIRAAALAGYIRPV